MSDDTLLMDEIGNIGSDFNFMNLFHQISSVASSSSRMKIRHLPMRILIASQTRISGDRAPVDSTESVITR